MVSLKARIVNGLMRNRHLFQGKPRKEVFKQDIDSVLEFRAECEKGAARFGKLAKGVVAKQEVINLTLSELLTPENAAEGKLIFNVHGGGYVSGFVLGTNNK